MRLFGGVRYIDRPSSINVRRLDLGALPLISDFHRNGIRVDIPYLANLEKDFAARLDGHEYDVLQQIGPAYSDFDGKRHAPFSITSPDHVARLLFHHLRVQGHDLLSLTDSQKRETTSDDVLQRYRAHPVVNSILQHRALSKLQGTYVIPLQAYALADPLSRVHTRFSVTTAATGRLASSDPNLQNIPTRSELGKLIRAAFISSPGTVLVSCDLSQIEMRWAAHLAQDPVMMRVFIDDEDIHDRTACNIFRRDLSEITAIKKKVKKGLATTAEEAIYKYFLQFERLPSKNIGFGVLYGQTGKGLQQTILESMDPKWSDQERADFQAYWTETRCNGLIEDWYAVYARIKAWMQLQFTRAMRWGMTWDAFGRMRLVPEVYSVHRRIRAEGLRKSGNHAIQSSAQGTIKVAMAAILPLVHLFHRFGHCLALLQIHDELMFQVKASDAPSFADAAREVMETATPLSIPVKSSSDIAERWSQLK